MSIVILTGSHYNTIYQDDNVSFHEDNETYRPTNRIISPVKFSDKQNLCHFTTNANPHKTLKDFGTCAAQITFWGGGGISL